MGETEMSTSHDASTHLSLADKDSLKGRRCERVKTIVISNQVINVIVLPPAVEDLGSDNSDIEYQPDDLEDTSESASELEVKEELDMGEFVDIKFTQKEVSENVDMMFPVKQLQPNKNLQHIASVTSLEGMQQSDIHCITAEDTTVHCPDQLSGYNFLLEASHYWSTQPDMCAWIAVNTMSRNCNKMSKVTLLYSLLNASLVQYGIYHEQLSINESIVPYLCRHGTKMFIKSKLIRFCYKEWILHESDNYPYHTIIYSGKEFQVLNVPLNTRVATPTVDVILKA
ncbi:hypothetical protein T4E_5105 [Trichinella pseudospiralis]|uniref:PiggyBac transposable element-derived protein domain-containing protein n=1 Tax=Trichinella pseudospiralis TaxID=6337 RepID=A0A0V0XI20_TRIPS|nr:hypothetical protein T4E_5105 [Trichinella pseudospiralis]